MRIENIDVIQSHPLQALIEAGEQIFSRTTVAIGAWPHGVACFRRHNQLVAIGGKILAQQAAKIFLRAAGRRPVVIRQIEMGNAQVKGLAQQGALVIQRVTVAKVVPQPQRQEGQLQAAFTAVAVLHAIVAGGVS